MPVIEWSDAYTLGIAEIDEHHQHLCGLLNDTYEVFVAKEQKVAVAKVLEELIDYATYHFAAEERFLSHNAYSGLAVHQKQHADLIRQITKLQHELSAGSKALSLELIVFLKEWLLDHILKSDRAYADVIKPELEKSGPQGARIRLV
jgi:hemerythrin